MPHSDEQQPNATASTSDIERDERDERERSKVRFPYINLDQTVGLAQTVYNEYGNACELSQLAASLKTTVTSSKFRNQMSAAKMFGMIEPRSKTVKLTDLGVAVADPNQRAEAKVRAFLNVPLYQKLYENFNGQMLPQDTGLEAEMCKLGVTTKSVSRARQVFQKSATSAGFFASGRDRLVLPALLQGDQTAPETTESSEQPVVKERSKRALDLQAGHPDPLLRGLLSKLPHDKPFTPSERSQWLELARLALDMVYAEEDEDPRNP